MNLVVKRYQETDFLHWNEFIGNSRNSTFLFHRNFMGYNAYRFQDHSVLIYDDKDKIIGCFAANEKEGAIYAHQGLTYGGLVQKKEDKLEVTLSLWQAILAYYHREGITEVFYKHFPTFFNPTFIQDTEYTMFRVDAELYRRDTAFVIDYQNKFAVASNYKREAKKAFKENYTSAFSEDFEAFWNDLLVPNLEARFGVKPVHSLEEMNRLKASFQKEIKLYAAFNTDQKMVAGTVLFDCGLVRHCQYIAATDEARNVGALNMMFLNLIDDSEKEFRFFDFGIANEDNGRVINKGLAAWKQRMGGRAMVHDFYKIDLKNTLSFD